MRRLPTNQSIELAERNSLVIALAEYGRKAKGAISPNTERALKADTAVFAPCDDLSARTRRRLPCSDTPGSKGLTALGRRPAMTCPGQSFGIGKRAHQVELIRAEVGRR